MYRLFKSQLKKILRCPAKIKLKYVCGTIGLIIILDVYGAFTHIFEVSYAENFAYPYEGDVGPFVEALRRNKKPEVEPINVYNYTFLRNPKNKCDDPGYRTLRIVFLVKSASEHFERREGIRNSWGYGNRFFDVPTRLIFLVGTKPLDEEFDRRISAESERHKDILQADFVDDYYNNTIKTMMGFKWAVEYCKNAKFYMFVDDDIYVSVRNVLRFIRNPASYPDYLQDPGRMAVRKREIKDSDKDPRENKLMSDEQENVIFSRRKIGKGEATERKISSKHNALAVSETENIFQNPSRDVEKNVESSTNKVESANPASYPDYPQDPGRMAVRKREIKDSDEDPRENKLVSDEQENVISSKRKISKGEATERKISSAVSETEKIFQSPSRDAEKNVESSTNEANSAKSVNNSAPRNKRQVFDLELPDDVRLYAGNVFPSSSPARHKISRWYVSLKEYPYNLWPPYVTAGAYILSKEALLDMYYASLYTQHFRFDDIFLGIVAKKAEIEVFHCDEFHFYKKDYTRYNYKYVITSHGYDDPSELRSVWQEQKSLGNA